MKHAFQGWWSRRIPNEEEFVHFLMTDGRPRGTPPTLPPMPPYRLTREDAEGVVAHIHSLPPAKSGE